VSILDYVAVHDAGTVVNPRGPHPRRHGAGHPHRALREVGIKGGGEGGRMGAPGALSGAIEDALAQYGVRCDELPLTRRKVQELVRAGEKR
jgi:CO/xanthine dehydrogenase Mo-binding subunit